MARNDGLEIEAQGRSPGGGMVASAAVDLPELVYVRLSQRHEPPRDPRWGWLLLVAVLLAHLVLAWFAWRLLRPEPNRHRQRASIAVTVIASPSTPPSAPVPPPPLPVPTASPVVSPPAPPVVSLPAAPPVVSPPLPVPTAPPAAPSPRHLHHVPPAKGAIRATLEGHRGTPLKLYGPNGRIHLAPSRSPTTKSVPSYRVPELKASHVDRGKSPVPYAPTRFSKNWAPANQSLGAKTVGRAFDQAVEKTTLRASVRLPGGGRIHCALAPLLLMAAGCRGSAPPAAPGNDDDVRLSMPPARTLTGHKVPLPVPAVSSARATSPGRH